MIKEDFENWSSLPENREEQFAEECFENFSIFFDEYMHRKTDYEIIELLAYEIYLTQKENEE